MTIREFARLVLPIYRRERWRWSSRNGRQMRVPSETAIIHTVRQLMFHKPILRQGFTCRSGGLIVERRTAKTFVVSMMPRRFFHTNGYNEPYFDHVFHPVVKEVVTV